MNGDTEAAECAVHTHIMVTVGYIDQGIIVPRAGAYVSRCLYPHISKRGVALTTEGHSIFIA